MTRQVFDNSMCAHVWAAGGQNNGRSQNGNLFFTGRILYSYGAHYVAGYRGDAAHFVNRDSYSISTARHTSLAWRAASGRGNVWGVSGLTDLVQHFTRAKSCGTLGERRAIAGAVAHEMTTGPNAKSWAHVANGRNCAAVFEELGIPLKESLKRAARVQVLARAVLGKVKAEREAAKTAESLDLARDVDGWGPLKAIPAFVFEELGRPIASFRESRSRDGRRWGYFSAGPHRERAEDWGRELHRAGRAAKARGWGNIAAKCRAAHKAVRQYVAESHYQAEESRLRVFRDWANAARNLKSTAARLDAGELKSWHDFSTAKTAAETLARLLAPHGESYGRAGRALRLMGGNPGETLARLQHFAQRVTDAEERQREKDARAGHRRDVAALRAFRDDPSGASVATCDAARRAIGSKAESFLSYSRSRIGGHVPRVFRVAGWTGAAFAEELARVDARHAEAVREEHAATLARWHKGEAVPLPRELGGWGGPALVRAVDVQRDDSGAITGGTLQTSQGASVPLVDAVRAFRFVAAVRAAGRPWARNGQRLRVGHFEVDRIEASGDFKAGCHQFQWAEIARSAEELGIATAEKESTE